ncbi:MAG: hypothetical protein HQM12_04370 [SAR324 cluster bacterium]|nr:hypothetical protein [SAR324 cluster bacterium]
MTSSIKGGLQTTVDVSSVYFLFVAGDVELNCILSGKELPCFTLDQFNCYQDEGVWIVYTGVGAFNSMCATHAFLTTYRPAGCFHLGFSGAHLPELPVGMPVIADKVVAFSRHTKTPDGTVVPRKILIQKNNDQEALSDLPSDRALYTKLKAMLKKHHIPFETGIIGYADQFNSDISFIKKIQEVYGTLCEDMESGAVSYIARRYGIPFAGIRIISNNELWKSPAIEGTIGFEAIAFERLSVIAEILIQTLAGRDVCLSSTSNQVCGEKADETKEKFY